MARDSRKHQKSVERKKAKRKAKQSQLRQAAPPNLSTSLRRAASWPLYEVLLSEAWTAPDGLAQIIVARTSFTGQIAAAAFLVDLMCLGVKSALVHVFDSYDDYEWNLRRGATTSDSMRFAELDLVAKIIQTGLDYARQLGFHPDPDYQHAKLLLSDANPAASPIHVPVGGPEGKPLFIAGPYDDVPQIIRTLTRAVGPDGFHVILPVPEDELDQLELLDEDEEAEV
jgi:hypothetical protein